MHSIFLLSILTFLSLKSFASPYSTSSSYPRQAESLLETPVAGITAIITSVNGTDISSAFQTLLYRSPTVIVSSNLTDRDLVDRQSPDFIRPINFCRRRRARFESSECDYRSNLKHRLGRFNVRCRLMGQHSEQTAFIIEPGACNADEICVNGPLNPQGMPTVANCVGERGFGPLKNYNTPEGRATMAQSLKGSIASALVSQTDRQTAMIVESLEIDAGVVGRQVGPTSQRKCTDCAEIITGNLEEGTDYLSTAITVNMAGTAVTAGILWLAILSG